MGRLKSLDALRGFAILSMIPFHILVFGMMMAGQSPSEWIVLELGESELVSSVVAWATPLGTGLVLFFFVTGMSLAVSLAGRRENQSFSTIGRRIFLRYGSYVLAGIVSEVVLWAIITQGQVGLLDLTLIAVSGAIFSGPIIGVGLSALVAFPLILRFSWRKLLIASSVLALVVGSVLYYLLLSHGSSPIPSWGTLPQYSPLNPFLTGGFALLKCLPMVLVGATIGKLVVKGKDVTKISVLIGAGISFAYAIVPTLYGSNMMHILVAYWAFPHALLFSVGNGLFLFGLFRILETRKITLTPATVVGRSSLLVYYGHFGLLFPLLMLIGPENLSIEMLGILMVSVTLSIWILVYFYSKWRWGPPSKW